jgi:hypothetical protein
MTTENKSYSKFEDLPKEELIKAFQNTGNDNRILISFLFNILSNASHLTKRLQKDNIIPFTFDINLHSENQESPLDTLFLK